MRVAHKCGLARARRGAIAALATAGVLAGRPAVGAAQDSAGTLTGVVTALDGGEPLPFSTVAIESPTRVVFTDSAGTFRISGLAPGSYRVLIRELGYAPEDTLVDVTPGPPGVPIPFALARIPIPLPPVAVRAPADCRTPGMPDSSVSPELAALAVQMRLNAQRSQLLATKYPYEYDVQAWITGRQPSSAFEWGEEIDTLTFQSWVNRPYRVAHVVDTKFVGRRPRGRYLGPYVYLPDLADLADSSFQAWHCFTFGGTAAAGDQTVVRVDFAPARALHDTDVAGSVYLDAARMVVRRASFWLTRPERLVPAVRSYRVEVWYREVLPLVAIEDSVHVVQTWGSVVTGGEHTSTEAQRVIGYRLHVPTGTE